MLTKNKVRFAELMKFKQGQNIQVKRGIKLLSNNYRDALRQYSQITMLDVFAKMFLKKRPFPHQTHCQALSLPRFTFTRNVTFICCCWG